MNANVNNRLGIGFVFGLLGAGALGVVGAIIGVSSGDVGTGVAFAAAGAGVGAGIGGLIGASAVSTTATGVSDDD